MAARRDIGRAGLLSCASFALVLLFAPALCAKDTEAEKIFTDAVAALDRGAVDDSIDLFESLADRGFVNADASFDRAAAYVARARSPNARPGDLGKSVAALEEALILRPGDGDAERALERIRGEIARRRARVSADPVESKTTLGRAVVGLVDEDVWAILAVAGSALLTLGLVVRRLSRAYRARLGANTAAGIGLFVLLTAGSMARVARHLRETSQPAVVVVAEARLLDETGRPVVQKNGVPEHVTMAEGTSVWVTARSGELARVEWGTTEAWVNASQLRVLALR
jgi:microcompartment protein CcmK/EutM